MTMYDMEEFKQLVHAFAERILNRTWDNLTVGERIDVCKFVLSNPKIPLKADYTDARTASKTS